MNFLSFRLAAFDAWFARRTAFLTHPRAGLIAVMLVPLLSGLASVLLGQDDGWDLRNYHLYNVYALLNDRIGFDLAPGRFQTYFNPTLDLLHYLLTHRLSPRAGAFAMGTLHGVNFVLLLGIARQLAGPAAGMRLPLLLAGACMLGPTFRGELGNTMGDNTTALLVLAALYLMLSNWDALREQGAKAALTALCAGLLMGMGTGLKLTNATYAVALCLSFLAVPRAYWQRLCLAFVFGVGVLAGISATAGWWFLKMWRMFGNPLFPQLNNIFHSPWATQAGVIDTYFLPKSLSEYLLWPFIFAGDSTRVTEVPIKLGMWPAAYVLLAVGCVVMLARRLRGPLPQGIGSRGAFFLLFVGLAYLAWMRLFSIYRYLIPLELLLPLAIWLLWRGIAASPRTADRLAGVMLALLFVHAFSIPNWGRASWAERAYSAEVPTFNQPEKSVVFIAQPEPPMAWLATMFPQQVKFIGVDTGFPESPAWRQRMRQAVAERSGTHFVLLAVAKNEKQGSLQNKLDAARRLGLTEGRSGCDKLDWLARHVRLQAAPRALPSGGCTLELLPQHRVDLAAKDRAILEEATRHLRRFDLAVDAANCQVYKAALGAEPYPYRLCRVTTAVQ